MRYDFHSHSHFSDGTLSPTELVQRAEERDINLLALSDHDSVSGLIEATIAIEQQGLSVKLINAIEISAQTDFGEIHIVGLGINPKGPALVEQLAIQQNKRWERAILVSEKLDSLNVHGVLDFLRQNCVEVVTRTHMARALVELGHVKDNQQAFKKYLGKKGRVKVPASWMPMEQAIELIHQSGGLAVIAHPTRYPVSNRRLSYLIEEFKLAGGDGIEVSYPSLNPDKRIWLEALRDKHDLLASAGSDFHYPDLRWTDLGRFPPVDVNVPHVIDKLQFVSESSLNLQ